MPRKKEGRVNIKEIRRLNFRAVADRLGRDVIAEKYPCNESYINQLCGKSGKMGDKTARKLERVCRLPEDYLDTAHPETWGQKDAERFFKETMKATLPMLSLDVLEYTDRLVRGEFIKRSK